MALSQEEYDQNARDRITISTAMMDALSYCGGSAARAYMSQQTFGRSSFGYEAAADGRRIREDARRFLEWIERNQGRASAIAGRWMFSTTFDASYKPPGMKLGIQDDEDPNLKVGGTD